MKTRYALLIAALSAFSLGTVACGGDTAKGGGTTPTATATTEPSAAPTTTAPASTGPTADTAPTTTTPSATPPASSIDPAVFDQALTVAEKMVEIVVADQNNCDKMAVDLKKFIDENKEIIQKAKEQNKKLTTAEKHTLQEKYETRIRAMAEKGEKASKKCESNPKVKDAMRALNE